MSGNLRILSAFILFVSIFITSSFAGEVSLPRTTDNPVSYAPGDDGDIQAGIAWPSPRFTNNHDGTLTDNLTGLMWMKDADCVYDSGYTKVFNNVTSKPLPSWSQAFDFVGQLNKGAFNNMSGYTARYTDWRVPNINEMESLVRSDSAQYTWLNYYKYFVNFQNTFYTSSTTVAGDPSYAWVINMICGKLVQVSKNDSACYMVPVRGVSNGPAQVWQTGQTVSYRGTSFDDDGALRTGVAWDPVTRFIDNTDGTVADTLTGLMWMKDATSRAVGTGSINMTWADALTYVASLNSASYLGYTDWRLPNRKELRSLLDYSQAGIPLPAGYPFKVNSTEYWTSSRDVLHSNPTVGNAFWFVAMNQGDSWFSGTETYEPELGTYQVWPVRAGVTNGQVPSKYTLTINKAGDGTGQVTATPSGINCGESCATDQASFNANDEAVLTADPSSDSIFNGWTGGVTGSSSTVIITMNSNMTITANFGKSSYSLTASANPAAGGTVALSAQGPYAPNTQVTLTPKPATGYQFNGWSGDASGMQNPLTVTMNKNMTITANFMTLPDMLSLDYAQNGKAVTLNASLKIAGNMIQGQRVQFFETIAGKDVPCGKAVTGSDGTCRKKAILKPGTHVWYAKAGQEISSPVSCTIGQVTYTSLSPVNKAVVTVPDPDLSWQAYDNAVGYEVQVSNKPDFRAAFTAAYPATGTTFNAEALSMGKKYFWRVIAELPKGTSIPSVARSIVYRGATNLSLALTSVSGNKGTFQAALTDAGGSPIPGKRVKITGSKLTYGLTGSDGLLVKTVTLPAGPYSVEAAFAGDANYAPSVSSPVSGTNP